MSLITFILFYLGVKLVDKFIEDNLPNLHYKKVFNTAVSFAFIWYIFIICWWQSLFKKPPTKEFITFLAALVVAMKLAELKKQKEKPQHGLTGI